MIFNKLWLISLDDWLISLDDWMMYKSLHGQFQRYFNDFANIEGLFELLV